MVKAQFKQTSDEDEHGKTKARARQKSSSRTSTEAYGRDGDTDATEASPIPSAQDLARSFLNEEPVHERQELEAALLSQSRQALRGHAPTAYEDEDIVGTGTGLSLPGFLTGFLKGVADRLEISVKNVDVQLEAEITLNNGKDIQNAQSKVPVSVQLRVEELMLARLASETSVVGPAPTGAETSDAQDPKHAGKRRIGLKGISAFLVSEASVFERLSRISTPSSPLQTGFASPEERTTQSISTSPDKSGKRTSSSTGNSIGSASQSQQTSRPDTPTPGPKISNSPGARTHRHAGLGDSVLTHDSDRFADAGDEESVVDRQIIEPSVEQDSNLTRSVGDSMYKDGSFWDDALQGGLLDSRFEDQSESQFLHSAPANSLQPSQHPRSDSMASPLVDVASKTSVRQPNLSATVPTSSQGINTRANVSKRLVSSQPMQSFGSERAQVNIKDNLVEAIRGAENSDKTEMSASTRSAPVDEDLSESKLFSHEDAASMYYSLAQESMDHGSGSGPEDYLNAESNTAHLIQSTSLSGAIPTPNSVRESVSHDEPGSPSADSPSRDSVLPPALEEGSDHMLDQSQTYSDHGIQTNPDDSAEISSPGRDTLLMAKRFMTVDEVSLFLPGGIDSDAPAQSVMSTEGNNDPNFAVSFSDESFAQNVPGAFSQYAGSTATRRRKSSNLGERPGQVPPTSSKRVHPDSELPRQVATQSRDLECLAGSVEMVTDISTARLMTYLIQQISAALGSDETEQATTATSDNSSPRLESHYQLFVNLVSIRLVEQLSGSVHLVTDEAPPDWRSAQPLHDIHNGSEDYLLGLTLTETEISHAVKERSQSMLNIDKFKVSFANEDIVSFDARARMRTSTRDLREPQIKDVSISFTKSATASELRIATLPLLVSLNIHRLDETLGMFGGFSSVMELGTSIGSNSTVLAASPKNQSPARGVHFEAIPPEQPPSNALKVNARFGGALFSLKGKSCAVALQTSAVKVVSRAGHVGLQIDDIRLTGPYRESQREHTAVAVQLGNNRIDFLSSPGEDDLDQLVMLVAPSRGGHEDDGDILLNTLLAQRKKGAVLRISSSSARLEITAPDDLSLIQDLGAEISRLSSVTKYLPEESRPGMLCQALIKELEVRASVNEQIGTLSMKCQTVKVANVTLPSLFAVAVGKISAVRSNSDVIVHEVLGRPALMPVPMLMARIVGDDIEPTLKVKLNNTCFEYSIPTIMAFMGLSGAVTTEDLTTSLAASVATIKDYPLPRKLSRQAEESSDKSSSSKPWRLDILLQDCAVGLNAAAQSAKGLFVLTNTHFTMAMLGTKDISANLEIRKASFLLTDNAEEAIDKVEQAAATQSGAPPQGTTHVGYLCGLGFISVSTISAARAAVKLIGPLGQADGPVGIDVDFRDDLFILETCADSTQTLINLLNSLKPPMPPSKEIRFRTEVMPVQDMMDSFSGDAYTQLEADDTDEPLDFEEGDPIDDDVPTNLEYVGSLYNTESPPSSEVADSMLADEPISPAANPNVRRSGDKKLLESFQEQYEIAEGPLDFQDNYFGPHSEATGAAHVWDSSKNKYGTDNVFNTSGSPLKVRVRDVHIIWNLFDGYDWQRTRDIISEAVKDVELRAEERRKERRRSFREEDQEEPVIGDYLFNSIWIEVPPNRDPRDLSRQINRNIDDLVSETGSYATSAVSQSPSRQSASRTRAKRLKLERSKHHKVTFELKGVSADLVVLPPGTGETQSSIDVRIMDFDIFDHVPTSTWKKFATYMRDAGERELNKPMIHLELLNVRPVADLAASEIVLRVRHDIPCLCTFS